MKNAASCLVFALALALAGCGTFDAERARTHLTNSPESSIISCMGVPAEKVALSPASEVLQWDYAQASDAFDLALGIYSVKIGRPGVCHVSITFVNNYVTQLHYSGTVVNLSDPDTVCGNLVHDCLWRRSKEPLTVGFVPLTLPTGSK